MLVSRQRVEMTLTSSYPITQEASPPEFVAELRDAAGQVLHRAQMPNPLAPHREVFSEDPDRSIQRDLPAATTVKNGPAGASCPPAGPGHEYMVVWAGKMNAGDLEGKDALIFANGGAINPQAIRDVLPQETLPGNDMIATIDVERGCSTYGNVVNVALLSGADAVENEPHHMQYVWFPGQPLWAGGLFTSRLFTWDASALPKVSLISTQEPFATPGGSIWDAFDVLPDGTAYGTLMGGPLQVYGMTPGEVVHIGPKGEILPVSHAWSLGLTLYACQAAIRHPALLGAAATIATASSSAA